MDFEEAGQDVFLTFLQQLSQLYLGLERSSRKEEEDQ